MMELSEADGPRSTPALEVCAFVICNQLGQSSQSADEKAQMQFTSNFLRSKLTSAARGGTGEAGFALN